MEMPADKQPQVITPSIGRRIWYWPSLYDRGRRTYTGDHTSVMDAHDPSQPCAASIVYVHGDRMVNLSVVDHSGRQHARTSVTLVQPGDPIPEGQAYAAWMDCHVQQAAPKETYGVHRDGITGERIRMLVDRQPKHGAGTPPHDE